MAKRSKVARDAWRREGVARHASRRRELKALSVSPYVPPHDREAAMRQLHRLPRDASPTRLRNRDVADGRPRGILRRFGLSRVRVRQMARRGELPGITKSSW